MDTFYVSCFPFLYCLAVPYSHMITCRLRAELLAVLCVVLSCVFVTSPDGVQGQVGT